MSVRSGGENAGANGNWVPLQTNDGVVTASITRADQMHTRASTDCGPDYCVECSERAEAWVKWRCPSMCVCRGTGFYFPDPEQQGPRLRCPDHG